MSDLPSDSMLRLFLSYRRDDCAMHAGRLADNFRDRGVAEVFIDVDEIHPGQNFVQRIEEEIARCDAVLVMIGDDWMTLAGQDGRPRIHDQRDWVYLEVKAALERDVPVIPVLVEGAQMPSNDDLPQPIGELAYRMAVVMRESSWNQDYGRLASALPDSVGDRGRDPQGDPVPTSLPSVPKRERARIDFVAARAFIESIPPGRWSSYKDVAAAGGSPQGAQAIGNWLRTRGEGIPNVWRVLDSAGRVSEGFDPQNPRLPQGPAAVRDLLQREGLAIDGTGRADDGARWSVQDAADSGAPVASASEAAESNRSLGVADTLIVAGRMAYPDYLLSSSYICQQGRSFRNDVSYLGFYAERTIKPEIARILERRDNLERTNPELSPQLDG